MWKRGSRAEGEDRQVQWCGTRDSPKDEDPTALRLEPKSQQDGKGMSLLRPRLQTNGKVSGGPKEYEEQGTVIVAAERCDRESKFPARLAGVAEEELADGEPLGLFHSALVLPDAVSAVAVALPSALAGVVEIARARAAPNWRRSPGL